MAGDKHHGAVAALMLLAKVHDRGVFEQSGHVRASAACALSFLACHNMGARGDECLTGPYRPALLEQGALVRMLAALGDYRSVVLDMESRLDLLPNELSHVALHCGYAWTSFPV